MSYHTLEKATRRELPMQLYFLMAPHVDFPQCTPPIPLVHHRKVNFPLLRVPVKLQYLVLPSGNSSKNDQVTDFVLSPPSPTRPFPNSLKPNPGFDNVQWQTHADHVIVFRGKTFGDCLNYFLHHTDVLHGSFCSGGCSLDSTLGLITLTLQHLAPAVCSKCSLCCIVFLLCLISVFDRPSLCRLPCSAWRWNPHSNLHRRVHSNLHGRLHRSLHSSLYRHQRSKIPQSPLCWIRQ